MDRKIIHIDMDYFFAQVEIRDNPKLKGKPVAIGGSKKSRGVLSTCNYEARKFGVSSAQPTYLALQKCPNLIVLNGNYAKYKKASEQVLNILKRYTDTIQVVSIDEAYLDVTETTDFYNSATLIAQDIRKSIFLETGLTASAGVSFNKMLAKISSDINKPNGMFVIEPKNYKNIIPAFNVKLINGVGKVTLNKLNAHGIHTFEDLLEYSKLDLINAFGSFGPSLYNYCRGIDSRPVKSSKERKSLSVEKTFEKDLSQLDELKVKLYHCYEEMIERLKNYSDRCVKTAFVKIKYSNFKQTTIEEGISILSFQQFQDLLLSKITHKEFNSDKIRLLGIGVKFHCQNLEGQLALL